MGAAETVLDAILNIAGSPYGTNEFGDSSAVGGVPIGSDGVAVDKFGARQRRLPLWTAGGGVEGLGVVFKL